MVYLPKEIMTHIYEYDRTYKVHFDKVLVQLGRINQHYNLYIHNYMFHCDINYVVGIEYHNRVYFAKRSFV